jgi:hypothetical protein
VVFAAPAQFRMVVNIPAYRLDAYVGDSVARTTGVAVGMPRFRTPRGSFTITSVEWNPWWIPPKSPWAAKDTIMRPGPTNPMGRVKINFGGLYFLHGTPLPRSVGSAASHGCLRLQNAEAIALARLVLQYGNGMFADGIERYAADTATRWLRVDNPLPIDVRYELVEVRGGRVFVYRDIYALATRPLGDEVFAALVARGVDSAAVDSARVHALVRRVGRAGNSTPLDSLIKRTLPSASRATDPMFTPDQFARMEAPCSRNCSSPWISRRSPSRR